MLAVQIDLTDLWAALGALATLVGVLAAVWHKGVVPLHRAAAEQEKRTETVGRMARVVLGDEDDPAEPGLGVRLERLERREQTQVERDTAVTMMASILIGEGPHRPGLDKRLEQLEERTKTLANGHDGKLARSVERQEQYLSLLGDKIDGHVESSRDERARVAAAIEAEARHRERLADRLAHELAEHRHRSLEQQALVQAEIGALRADVEKTLPRPAQRVRRSDPPLAADFDLPENGPPEVLGGDWHDDGEEPSR